MIDTTDQGSIYGSFISEGQPVVDTVQQLQISDNLIFGARDEDYYGDTARRPGPAISYFLLNTSDRSKTEFSSLGQLRQQALSRRVKLKLRAFNEVFSEYRYTWFDFLAAAILFLVPAAGFLLLARWIWKTRNSSPPVSAI
ncbi:MAG TPA: hypothetical protein VFS41_10435 [Edaphobacter sp.]|nr:hypothetical protein [Edaphobacter sp.]